MKYLSAIIMVISIFATGWGLMEVNRQIGASYILPVKQVAGNDSMAADIEKEALSAEQMAGKLAHLQVLLAPGVASSAVIAVGASTANGKPTELAPKKLTMLYFSPNFRRAVIDGQVVGAGGELADGSKVLSVNLDNVVIRRKGGETTLTIPKDKILIGSVHGKPVVSP